MTIGPAGSGGCGQVGPREFVQRRRIA